MKNFTRRGVSLHVWTHQTVGVNGDTIEKIREHLFEAVTVPLLQMQFCNKVLLEGCYFFETVGNGLCGSVEVRSKPRSNPRQLHHYPANV